METDLILFKIGQVLLVIISGYLMCLGLPNAILIIDDCRKKHYENKKKLLKLKKEIYNLKKWADKIDKLEPDNQISLFEEEE